MRWHQDTYNFGTNSEHILSCGAYLEDADRETDASASFPGATSPAKLPNTLAIGKSTAVGPRWTNQPLLIWRCPAGPSSSSLPIFFTVLTTTPQISRITAPLGTTLQVTAIHPNSSGESTVTATPFYPEIERAEFETMKSEEVIISELRSCEPASALVDRLQSGGWRVVDYETIDGLRGKCSSPSVGTMSPP